jgi:hypothetical protein
VVVPVLFAASIIHYIESVTNSQDDSLGDGALVRGEIEAGHLKETQRAELKIGHYTRRTQEDGVKPPIHRNEEKTGLKSGTYKGNRAAKVSWS